MLNWGRASKSILYKLKILQNKILRAMLFSSKQDRTNLLYFKLKIFETRGHDRNGICKIYIQI